MVALHRVVEVEGKRHRPEPDRIVVDVEGLKRTVFERSSPFHWVARWLVSKASSKAWREESV